MEREAVQQYIFQYYQWLQLAHHTDFKPSPDNAQFWKPTKMCIIGIAEFIDKITLNSNILFCPAINSQGRVVNLAIHADQYRAKYASLFNTVFSRSDKTKYRLLFSNVEPGFVKSPQSRPKSGNSVLFFFTDLTQVVEISQVLYESILRPLQSLFRQQYSMLDLSDAPVSITVDYLKSLQIKQMKVISGITQIVMKEVVQIGDINRRKYVLNVYQKLLPGKKNLSQGVYKLHIEYNSQQDQQLIKNWHNYAFYDVTMKVTWNAGIIYALHPKLQNLKKGLSPIFLLQQATTLPQNRQLLALNNIIQIPINTLTRNTYRFRVMLTEFQILIAQIKCQQCKVRLTSDKCTDCNRQGQLTLWSQCLVQDQTTVALLNLQHNQTVSFYQLDQRMLQLLTKAVLTESPLCMYLARKDKQQKLMPIYNHLRYFTCQRDIIGAPYIDIRRTQKETLAGDDIQQEQLGFLSHKQNQGKLRVFINGTYYRGQQVVALQVKTILPKRYE